MASRAEGGTHPAALGPSQDLYSKSLSLSPLPCLSHKMQNAIAKKFVLLVEPQELGLCGCVRCYLYIVTCLILQPP
jgi:hypothetical protein